MNEHDSDQLDSNIVLQKLTQAIEANGDITPKERDRLLVLGVTSILTMMTPLQHKVNKLEDKNIMIWIEKHTKFTSAIITGFFLLIMFLQEIGHWITTHIGMITFP
jgi:hypothetical protein